jgi:hypothetical protein
VKRGLFTHPEARRVNEAYRRRSKSRLAVSPINLIFRKPKSFEARKAEAQFVANFIFRVWGYRCPGSLSGI